MSKIYHIIRLFPLLLLLFFSCKEKTYEDTKVINSSDAEFDLDRIKEKGKLVALIDYSSTSYFIYKGTPMGFEYDLLNKLADHLEVDLELIPIRNMDSIFFQLNNSIGDIIAANLTVTQERINQIAFSDPHTFTAQVLVQKKPTNWRSMKRHVIDKQLIKDPINLAYKKIHIRKNSSFYQRLQNLKEEIGEPIYIEEVSGSLTTEQLIKKVSDGEIEYTIADQNVAKVNSLYYDNIDIGTSVSFNQKIAWALRKSSPKLKQEINSWLSKYKKTTEFAAIRNKYFKNSYSYKKRRKSDLYASKSGKISDYDQLIKKYAKELNWDWKLLSSLIYQESNFNPSSKSWAGAFGLMQIMPETAAAYGIDSTSSPEENIKAGITYLQWLDTKWTKSVHDKSERIKFVLASYNVGIGHIIDARNLAKKYGKNPTVWEGSVDEFILKKSQSKYYRDDVVKFGYCRGQETYKYVKEIMNRFEQYKNLIF